MVAGVAKFADDLATGEAWEQLAVHLLNRNHPNCNFIKYREGNFKAFDLVCDHCLTTIECKTDAQASNTGNFAFEQHLFEDSTAIWVLYKAGSDIYLLERAPLEQVIYTMLHRSHPDFTLMRGGDGNRQLLHLCRIATMTALGLARPFDLRVIGCFQLPQL